MGAHSAMRRGPWGLKFDRHGRVILWKQVGALNGSTTGSCFHENVDPPTCCGVRHVPHREKARRRAECGTKRRAMTRRRGWGQERETRKRECKVNNMGPRLFARLRRPAGRCQRPDAGLRLRCRPRSTASFSSSPLVFVALNPVCPAHFYQEDLNTTLRAGRGRQGAACPSCRSATTTLVAHPNEPKELG